MSELMEVKTVTPEAPVEDKPKKKQNPLLKRKNKFPGETFRLPSKGLMYFNGELDEEVVDGEVIVYPMTTLDEIYMRTPDMLFQGTAIDVVFKRRIPQVLKPTDLFANDIDFLLTCLRKVSYGETLEITHKCPVCEVTHKEDKIKYKGLEYEIPLNFFIQNSKEFTDADLTNMKCSLSTGEHVILRPCTFAEMTKIMQINEANIKTPEEMNEALILTLSSTIRSVDGTTEKDFIAEWLNSLPRKVISEFSTKLENVNRWGPQFEYTVECRECKKPQTLTTVLNPLYFFIQPSRRTMA